MMFVFLFDYGPGGAEKIQNKFDLWEANNILRGQEAKEFAEGAASAKKFIIKILRYDHSVDFVKYIEEHHEPPLKEFGVWKVNFNTLKEAEKQANEISVFRIAFSEGVYYCDIYGKGSKRLMRVEPGRPTAPQKKMSWDEAQTLLVELTKDPNPYSRGDINEFTERRNQALAVESPLSIFELAQKSGTADMWAKCSSALKVLITQVLNSKEKLTDDQRLEWGLIMSYKKAFSKELEPLFAKLDKIINNRTAADRSKEDSFRRGPRKVTGTVTLIKH